MQARQSSTNPFRFHLVVALLLTLTIGGAFWHFVWPTLGLAPLLVAWLVSLNLVAFGYYGFDKWMAGRGGRRVPELVLHILALLGGSVGAFAGMQLFRHKTLKGRFRIVFWAIVLLQAGLIACLLVASAS